METFFAFQPFKQCFWFTTRKCFLGVSWIWKDRRPNIKRGGLIFYIKKSLNSDVAGYISKLGHEISTIRIRLGRNKWISLTNIYIPPPNSTGQTIKFDPNLIPNAASSLICGDFNAHHPSWDAIQSEDNRGTQLFEWSSTKKLTIIYSPSPHLLSFLQRFGYLVLKIWKKSPQIIQVKFARLSMPIHDGLIDQ